jgi:quercetin dioxygenase-like cupin family protein
MALAHARSGDVVDVRPLGARLREHQSAAIVRDDRIELMRLVLADGRGIPEHSVEGPVTFLCIEGSVEVYAAGERRTLDAGELVYLEAGVPYSIHPIRDASVLMTVVRC